MHYYSLKPEVAGDLGDRTILDATTHPSRVIRLEYKFDLRPNDDLLETFPCYIVTERLKKGLLELSPSGCEFDYVEVSQSEDFKNWHGDLELSDYAWLKVSGRPGVDDFGISDELNLVVSERILSCLQRFSLTYCEIEEFLVY